MVIHAAHSVADGVQGIKLFTANDPQSTLQEELTRGAIAAMDFPELLDAVNQLSAAEQRQLRIYLDQATGGASTGPSPAAALSEQAFLEQLVNAGRVCQLPDQRPATAYPAPVSVPGRPLSETLVEDRR